LNSVQSSCAYLQRGDNAARALAGAPMRCISRPGCSYC
jgi:hypothetical protein